jgi:hypothetical protein
MEEIIKYYKNNVLVDEFILTESTLKVITEMSEEEPDFDYSYNYYYTLIGKPCTEWREELYRQALLNKENGGSTGYYDEELLAFWRDIFDTMNENWTIVWEEKIKELENELSTIYLNYENSINGLNIEDKNYKEYKEKLDDFY